MKRTWITGLAVVGVTGLLAAGVALAQQPAKAAAKAAPAKAAASAPAGATVEGGKEGEAIKNPMGFMTVVTSSGWMGVVLWLGLAGTSVAGVYLIIDSFVKIRVSRIMPPKLVQDVKTAMEQGDLVKAMQHCKEEPGPMANILMAGFSNVEEGFDVIQEVINAVADLESERLLQKVTYLSVVSNLAPMLGLLGTVQGMIWAFATLATMQAGAAQQAMLAVNIAQALYTTAAGLLVAVPAVAFYYFYRNRANNIILGMVIQTIDLVKSLRNVEVVSE
jgi:biopolymer transport protein ExbB